MGTWRRFGRVAAISIAPTLLIGLFSASAFAQGVKPARSAAFTTSGSTGYRVSLESEKHLVRVIVSHGKPRHNHFEIAEYKLRVPRESRNGIHANLGGLGSISVRFKPSGAGAN